MQEQIEREINALPEHFVAVLSVPARDHDEAAVHILRSVMKQGSGSYVTVTKPAQTLQELFSLNHVSADIRFIDCVSGKDTSSKNVQYVDSPHDLTGIGIQLTKAMAGSAFVIVDSLNTLLLHNSRSEVLRFLQSLISDARKSKHAAVILNLKEDSDIKLIAEVEQFCDAVIEL